MKKYFFILIILFLGSFNNCFASNAVAEQSLNVYDSYYNLTGYIYQNIVQHKNNISGACFFVVNNRIGTTDAVLFSVYNSDASVLLATSSCTTTIRVNGDWGCCYLATPYRIFKDTGLQIRFSYVAGSPQYQVNKESSVGTSNYYYGDKYESPTNHFNVGLKFQTFYENTMPDLSTTTTINNYSTTTYATTTISGSTTPNMTIATTVPSTSTDIGIIASFNDGVYTYYQVPFLLFLFIFIVVFFSLFSTILYIKLKKK